MSLLKSFVLMIFATLFAMIVLPMSAFAADPALQGDFVFPSLQVWAIVAGSLVTAVTYIINKYAPWVGQGTKAFVLVITAAIAAGLTQSIDGGTVGFNDQTLQLVVTSVVAAFGSHLLLWKPSGIQAKLAQPEAPDAHSNAGAVVVPPSIVNGD